MCDTLVALGNSTTNGGVLFGKNSDREPNEPHVIIRVRGKRHDPGERIKCTYIEIDQVEETYDVILFKPSWIWGAEMGVNIHGLVIGNEAVFTKEKQGKDALLGMDILRLTLERCRTASEGASYITKLISDYGQGGKCGFTQNLRYDNSYILADFDTAYVVETAGGKWVIEEVKDVRSISNSLSINKSYCLASSNLNKKAGKDSRPDFKKSYDSRLYSKFSCGDIRKNKTEKFLRERRGNIHIHDFKHILRQHDDASNGKEFRRGSMKSICMHAGGVISSQTTGSLIVELINGKINMWATGSSLPCVSIYKPLWFTEDEGFPYSEQNQNLAMEFWKKREVFNRMLIENSIDNLNGYLEKRDIIENEIEDMALKAGENEEKVSIMKDAFEREEKLVDGFIEEYGKNEGHLSGNLYYKHYWRKLNKEFFS